MKHNIWNKEILKQQIADLQIAIDPESLSIFYDNKDNSEVIPIVYWHLDEVEEDASVAISMCNAIHLYHTDREELLKKLNYKILN